MEVVLLAGSVIQLVDQLAAHLKSVGKLGPGMKRLLVDERDAFKGR